MSARRYPSKEAREVIKAAERMGWRMIGYTGSGHPRLAHANGARYTIPATPSDRRGRMASLTDMRRLGAEDGNRVHQRAKTK